MRKFFILFIVLTFAFVSILGLSSSMNVNDQGQMINCPLMLHSSLLCQMGIADHITNWQQMFAALPSINILLAFLLGAFIVYFLSFNRRFSSLAPPKEDTIRLYRRDHREDTIFNPLLLAFSDGIVHSKIFPKK